MGKIIRLGEKSIERLAEIDFDSGHEADSASKRTIQDYRYELRERFAKQHEIFFGFFEGNTLKGYAAFKPFFPGHKHCELFWLSVGKKYQNKGTGTALANFIEEYARKEGFRKICLYANKTMESAKKFYEKRGYAALNEFPGYYGYPDRSKNTAVLYAKDL